jgi:serine/threonine-protein kinase
MASAPSDKGQRQRIGKYEILAHIASGGMGAVYRARDVDLGREVALKVLAPEQALRPGFLERFHHEARSAARLRHENIVAIYEFGQIGGTHYLALEYVDGIDLHDYVVAKGKLEPDEARALMIQAAQALDHAHSQGIVHRDIKPANFLITQRDGRPLLKLIDLGLAREVNDYEFRVTRAGSTVGTIDYMAPEQARDSRSADIRSDIYSLGCTFHHLLTGQAPFARGSLTERLYAHLEAPPPNLQELNPAVSPGLAAILRRMLAKRPEDRFQTPQEMLAALEQAESPALLIVPEEAGLLPLELTPPAVSQVPVPQRQEGTSVPKADVVVRAVVTDRNVRPAIAKTAEQGAPPCPPVQAGKKERGGRRLRKKSHREQEPGTGLLRWWIVAAGAAATAGVCLLVYFQLGLSEPAANTGKQPIVQHKVPTSPVAKVPKTTEPPPIQEKDTSTKADPKPVKAELAPLFPSRFSPDPKKVRTEFEGPLAALVPPGTGARVYQISRLPNQEAGQFSSVSEALKKIPDGQTAVLEINDNGPLFEPSVPSLGSRQVVIRAGKGYRPLLAWDIGSASEAAIPRRFVALAKGSLFLVDVDMVVKWPADARADQPAVLFHVKDGTLAALGCTFSVAGKHPQGTVLARLEGELASQCRFSRCLVRGSDISALHLQGFKADVLLDDCLVVGAERPLCRVTASEGSALTLRLVRSTLVCAGTLLKVRPAAAIQRTPALQVLCCDSLLAQSDPGADGALIHLARGVASDRVGWKAVGSIYAGWRNLVSANDATIPAGAQDRWWRLCGHTEGDKVLLESWPRHHHPEPEEVDPTAFATAGTGAHFKAITVPGPLGCDLAGLHTGRAGWAALTYDRHPLSLPPLPAADPPPTIRLAGDGLYHGERLTLSKGLDLGQHLKTRLARQSAGSRVVLHLSGSGEQPTSPVQLQGASLILYFEKPRGLAEPLTLVPGRLSGEVDALIQVEDGDLEVLGGRITFPSTQGALVPRHALQVRGGNLRLADCQLKAPFTAVSEAFQGLIAFAGSDREAREPPACAVSQSILLSGREILRVQGGPSCLRLQQSMVVAADDFLVLEPSSAQVSPSFQATLENSTFGIRRTLIDVQGGAGEAAASPVVIRAEASLFLSPFGAPSPSTLLRCDRKLLINGGLRWQGKGNGFDRQRLHRYVVVTGEPATEAQAFQAWAALWGTPGERAPLLVDLPKKALKLSPVQFRQLALPRTVRPVPGEVLPGADLARLGIVAGKK